jgi:Zn-ribbon-containing, possibly RNA-binding protein and truncated derivatives
MPGFRGLARESGEPSAVYRRLREVFGDKRPRGRKIRDEDEPFRPGRDPLKVAGAMDTLTSEMGWTAPMAEANVAIEWRELVGENIADHSTVLSVADGTLHVQCDSSAWATQLRLMRHELLSRIAEHIPEAKIDSITVSGPSTPSWGKGGRSVPGRGPRDTYG